MFDEDARECEFDDALFSSGPIHFADLFSGALVPAGVREKVHEQSTDTVRCLTDGECVLWAVKGDAGLLKKFIPDTKPPESVLGITLAVEKAFGTDLFMGWEIKFHAGQLDGWEEYFVNCASDCCDSLCADILAYLWGVRQHLQAGARKDLAKAVDYSVSLRRGSRPRSLDEVAQLARRFMRREGERQVQVAWTPAIEAGQVATLTWIQREIERDEFRIAWLERDGLAQRTLRQWARALHERIQNGSPAKMALIKSATPVSVDGHITGREETADDSAHKK